MHCLRDSLKRYIRRDRTAASQKSRCGRRGAKRDAAYCQTPVCFEVCLYDKKDSPSAAGAVPDAYRLRGAAGIRSAGRRGLRAAALRPCFRFSGRRTAAVRTAGTGRRRAQRQHDPAYHPTGCRLLLSERPGQCITAHRCGDRLPADDAGSRRHCFPGGCPVRCGSAVPRPSRRLWRVLLLRRRSL